MSAAPFTPDDFAKWRFQRDAVHFNGGATFFGWGHRCLDQPRLLVIDKYFRKDRSTQRSYLVDGKTACAELDAALAALAAPPVLTDEECRLLDALPASGWFTPDLRAPYLPLADAGLIEWGRDAANKVACRRVAPASESGVVREIAPKRHRWIGDDHPPGWRRVGQVDVADPADTQRARDRGYRIGSIYDGGTDSVAEPCAADIYECQSTDGGTA